MDVLERQQDAYDLLDAILPPERDQQYLDRAARPIPRAQYMRLTNRRSYIRLSRHRIVDRLPPYFDLEVSTAWVGTNKRWDFLHGEGPPLIFETMIFPNSPMLIESAIDDTKYLTATEHDALEAHHLLVTAFSQFMGDPVITPVVWSGKRRHAKAFRGMSARRRWEAQRGFPPCTSGSRYVRGRHGQPGQHVVWTWNPDLRWFEIERHTDPVPGPSPALRSHRSVNGRHDPELASLVH